MIYFLQCENGGPIKIGASDAFDKRIKQIQTACPYPLKILGTHSGSYQIENLIHTRFAEHRLHGEWFEPAPEILKMAEEGLQSLIPDIREYVRDKRKKGWSFNSISSRLRIPVDDLPG